MKSTTPFSLFSIKNDTFSCFEYISENTIFSPFLNHHLDIILTSFCTCLGIKKFTFSFVFSVIFGNVFLTVLGRSEGSILVDFWVDFSEIFGGLKGPKLKNRGMLGHEEMFEYAFFQGFTELSIPGKKPLVSENSVKNTDLINNI